MCKLTEQVVYLQGLADGFEIDEKSKEGKLITAMLAVMADMAEEITELSADLDEIYEYVEELDEDMAELEEEVYDELDDDDDDDYDFGCDCDCDDEDCHCFGDELDDEADFVEGTDLGTGLCRVVGERFV